MRVSSSSLKTVFSASTALQAAFFAFSFWSADISADIPNVKERIRAYEAQQDNAGVSVEDLAILRREQEALEARMPFPGLKVGDTAPDFTLIDARGEQVRLYDALEKATVVLIFYRGSWCPYCNLQLYALHETLPELEHLDARLIVVTPQLPDRSLKQIQQEVKPFQIVSDLTNSVMKDFQVYYELTPELIKVYEERLQFDLAEYNGRNRYVLPVTATFVIDRRAVIRAKHAKVDYTERMEPADILAALRAIKGAASNTSGDDKR